MKRGKEGRANAKEFRRLLWFSGSEGHLLSREDRDDRATNKSAILQREFTAVIRIHKFSNVYRK